MDVSEYYAKHGRFNYTRNIPTNITPIPSRNTSMFIYYVPVHIDELYCFYYKSTPDDLPKSAGWNFFDIQTEYQRMNVPNDQWVLCTANKDYEVRTFLTNFACEC